MAQPQLVVGPDKDIAATFKILLIGDSGTGKSSLLLRFTDDVWLAPDEAQATIGMHDSLLCFPCYFPDTSE
jgi:GTPase SAR1 family protein